MITRYTGNLSIEVRWDPNARLHVRSLRCGCFRAIIHCLDAVGGPAVEDAVLVTPPRALCEQLGFESEETLETIAKICIETALHESIALVVDRNEAGAIVLSKISPEYRTTNNGVEDDVESVAPVPRRFTRVCRRAGVAR